jgi:hypothetical protein
VAVEVAIGADAVEGRHSSRRNGAAQHGCFRWRKSVAIKVAVESTVSWSDSWKRWQ